MKKYANEELGVKFALKEKYTIRDILGQRERILFAVDYDWYSRYWLASISMLENWECEEIPVPEDLDLEADATRKVVDIIQWVANEVAAHMSELDNVPKNT